MPYKPWYSWDPPVWNGNDGDTFRSMAEADRARRDATDRMLGGDYLERFSDARRVLEEEAARQQAVRLRETYRKMAEIGLLPESLAPSSPAAPKKKRKSKAKPSVPVDVGPKVRKIDLSDD